MDINPLNKSIEYTVNQWITLFGMSIEIRGLDCFEMENKQEYDQLYTLLKFNFARLDNQSSPRLKPMVLEALNGGKKNVVLDLAEVEYLDSAGFSAILAANRICIEEWVSSLSIQSNTEIPWAALRD